MEYHIGNTTLDFSEKEENDRLKGKMYGYPQCCIDAYVKERSVSIVLKKKVNLSGFMPCTSCALEVIEEKKVLSDLILDSRYSIAGEFTERWKYHESYANTTTENINRRR